MLTSISNLFLKAWEFGPCTSDMLSDYIPSLTRNLTHSSVLAWRIQGRGSLVGCRLWGRTESDTTEAT